MAELHTGHPVHGPVTGGGPAGQALPSRGLQQVNVPEGWRAADGYLAATGLLALTALTFGQVLLRSVLRHPLSWSDEVARYLHMWVVFLGAWLALRGGHHVRVDLARQLLSPRGRVWLSLWSDGIGLAVSLVIVISGFRAIREFAGLATPAAGIPQSLVFLPATVGFGLMLISCARSVLACVLALRSSQASSDRYRAS